MNDLKLSKFPGFVNSKFRKLLSEAKQLKKDARDEGINMFVELKSFYKFFFQKKIRLLKH